MEPQAAVTQILSIHICLLLTNLRQGVIQAVVYGTLLHSCKQGVIQVNLCVSMCEKCGLCVCTQITFCGVHILCSVHLYTSWWTLRLFPLLDLLRLLMCIHLQVSHGQMFNFTCLNAQQVSLMVILQVYESFIWGDAGLFPQWRHSFYSHWLCVEGSFFSGICYCIFCNLTILVRVEWHQIVVVICVCFPSNLGVFFHIFFGHLCIWENCTYPMPIC